MHPIHPRFIDQISHTNCGPPSEVRKVHDSPYNVRHTSPRSPVICVYFSRSTIYTKYQYVCVCVCVCECVCIGGFSGTHTLFISGKWGIQKQWGYPQIKKSLVKQSRGSMHAIGCPPALLESSIFSPVTGRK